MRPLYASSALLLLLVAGSVLWTGSRPPDDDFYAMRKNFELFGSVYEELVGTYVTRIDPERFMRTGMDAMLGTLDPWTDFLDEADNVQIDLRGRRLLGDVGLNLGRRGGRITVLVPDEAASAYRQGIRTGDVVRSVGGQSVDSLSVPDVQELLRGDPGSVVDVEIEREGSGVLVFRLRREAPSASNVSLAERLPAPNDDIAYLKLDRFGQAAGAELAAAYRGLESAGPVRAVILDLRNNPGGLLSQAIAVSQLFLPQGTLVVSTRGRAPESNRAYHTQGDPVIPGVPAAVLVNGYSASASEIVAGALQDHDRAVVVGSASFGKGLVQVFRGLPYNTSLKLTMARYYTPSGRGIRKDVLENAEAPSRDEFRTAAGRTVREGYGVEPEVLVPDAAEGPLEEALEREAAFFLFAGAIVAEQGAELEAALEAGRPLPIDGGTIERFRRWLDDRDFEFRTPFERSLSELSAGDRTPPVRQAWEALQVAAARERDGAFERERDRLVSRLSDEVAGRLMGSTDQVRWSLSDDPVLGGAVEVVGSRERYDAALGSR